MADNVAERICSTDFMTRGILSVRVMESPDSSAHHK